MLWALYEAPIADPAELGVLLVLADHADDDGRNAWPGHAKLAQGARISLSTVKRRLRQLELDGYITRGDQALTAHLRADRRPIVWDLAMPEATTARGVSVTRRDAPRGFIQASTGGHPGLHGGSAVTYKPSLNHPDPIARERPTPTPPPFIAEPVPDCTRDADGRPVGARAAREALAAARGGTR